MPTIFLSYRRSDSQDVTGRIYDRLVARFTQKDVFKDVDSIPLGVSFPIHIRQMLRKTGVVLVIIGPTWVNSRDDQGQRRLDDPNDFVRLEVEIALRAGMPVVPVLVSNAAMPQASDLPASMQKLVARNGIAVRPDPDFNNDIGRLISGIDKLEQLLNAQPGKQGKKPSKDDSGGQRAEASVAKEEPIAAVSESPARKMPPPVPRPMREDRSARASPAGNRGRGMRRLIIGVVVLLLLLVVVPAVIRGGKAENNEARAKAQAELEKLRLEQKRQNIEWEQKMKAAEAETQRNALQAGNWFRSEEERNRDEFRQLRLTVGADQKQKVEEEFKRKQQQLEEDKLAAERRHQQPLEEMKRQQEENRRVMEAQQQRQQTIIQQPPTIVYPPYHPRYYWPW